MRLLLDTQALVWIVAGRRLHRKADAAYVNPANQVLVSAASYWELSIKTGLGKLDVDFEQLDAELDLNRIGWLPIERAHCRRAGRLPLHHRDPFDRLLIAQSLSETLPVISSDAAFDAYGVTRIW